MQLASTVNGFTPTSALTTAATHLQQAADGVASNTAEGYGSALRHGSIVIGVLPYTDTFSSTPAVRQAALAARELNTIAFTALATTEGEPARFDPPAAERVDAAVQAAREATEALRALAAG